MRENKKYKIKTFQEETQQVQVGPIETQGQHTLPSPLTDSP